MNEIEVFDNKQQETYRSIRNSVIAAQSKVYSAVNSAMVTAYWEIGEQIYKACGENDRAEYGKKILKYISEKLTEEFGKGYSIRNLRNMRNFYCTFPIRQTLSAELSWSHYLLLMQIRNDVERDFYTQEAIKSNWSVRQLDRQINTMYYKRILASRDKESVAAEIQTTEPKPEYEQIIKDPYVLEFLDLPANEHYYESTLEQALIDHLQKFLLELGRGFSFVARQKHFNVDGRHFYIDLVFYNYILKCFVLIDLKRGEVLHEDIGQMNFYLNYYREEMNTEGDTEPIGIVLGAYQDKLVMHYALQNITNQVFVSHYQLYLPNREQLEAEFRRFMGGETEKKDSEL